MAESDVHLNDIGTIFRVTAVEDGLAVDLSTQTELLIIFQKTDGSTVSKSAVVTPVPDGVGDGSDGQFEYISVDGDLDQLGGWKLQGKITLPTWVGKTSIGQFEVTKNL